MQKRAGGEEFEDGAGRRGRVELIVRIFTSYIRLVTRDCRGTTRLW